MKTRDQALMVGGLAVVWIAVVFSFYHIYHKPFNPEQAVLLGRALAQLLAALWITAISGGLGAWLWKDDRLPIITLAVMQSALGLGILAIVYLSLSAVLGVSRGWTWGFSLVLTVLLRSSIFAWLHRWRSFSALMAAGGRFGRVIAVLSGVILLATLIQALSPPLKFDALVYHLALPSIYLQRGQVDYLPQILFWGMPQTAEMLYTWMMGIAGAEAAAVLGWTFGMLSLVGLVSWVTNRLGGRAGWVAIASLLSGYTLAVELAWGYVEWLTVLFGVCFLIAFTLWGEEIRIQSLVLSGMFAGLALGVKYSAGVLAVAGLAGIAWVGLRQKNRSTVLRSSILFGITVCVVSLPWWIKNAAATGNPFYPFLFPAGVMDVARLEQYQGMPAWGNWMDTLFLPWRATMLGIENGPGYGASIGPLFLAFAPMAWIGWRTWDRQQKRMITVAALTVAAGLLVWMVGGRLSLLLIQSRLFLSIFPMLALLAAAGFAGLDCLPERPVHFGRVAGGLVLLAIGLNAYQVAATTIAQGSLQYLSGAIRRQAYLENNLGWYILAAQSVAALPEGSRVLMLWEPRSYYCIPSCEPDEVIDRWSHDLGVYGSGSAVLGAWRRSEFTHLLINQSGADFVRDDDPRIPTQAWRALDLLLASLPLQGEYGGYRLYGLSP